MRFSLVTKHGKRYKEKFSIMRNNISEACRAFNEMLPDEKEEYLIKVIKPIAFYYDSKGNLVNNEVNNVESILDEFETLRIDIESECQYRDLNGILRDKYRANEMLDKCIKIVKKYTGEKWFQA